MKKKKKDTKICDLMMPDLKESVKIILILAKLPLQILKAIHTSLMQKCTICC